MTPPPALFCTDLDGTLLDSDGQLPEANQRALEELGQRNIPRALVTGRALYGVRRSLEADFPIDYVVFSCGAGIQDWQSGKVLVSHGLQSEDVAEIWGCLEARDLSFMVQKPVPENHLFTFRQGGQPPRDFLQRVERWRDSCQAAEGPPATASQFLTVVGPGEGARLFQELTEALSQFTVVRATSPVDGVSTWLEIFPRHVSKGQGAQWLAQYLNLEGKPVLGVGNDYNDLTLLDWVTHPFVVENAPQELKAKYPVVSHFEKGGVGDAVSRWLPLLDEGSPTPGL